MHKQLLPNNVSVQHLWPVSVIFLIFLYTNTHPLRPHDFWWHMRVGQEIVTTGHIPEVDTFSYTVAGEPYDNYKSFWLMESVFYLLYRAGGPALIIFAHSLLVTAAYAIVLAICRQQSRNWRIAATATFFAALLGHNDWNVRPQGIAFPLAAAYLYTIYACRRRSRPWLLVPLPFCMLIWVNSHGSFSIGLALLGLWLAAESTSILLAWWSKRRFGPLRTLQVSGIALAAALLAVLANPRGPGAILYATGMASNPFLRQFVPEWAPPTFDTIHGAFFLAGLLLSALLLALSPARPDPFEAFTFLAFGFLGLQTLRGVVWYGMVMAPVVARHLSALVDKLLARGDMTEIAVRGHGQMTVGIAGQRRLNAALLGVMAVVAVLGLPWFKHLLPLPAIRRELLSAETPVVSTQFLLDTRLPQPIFHELAFGSYLIWTAYPNYRVFVDTRLELYPVQVWEDYMEISAARPGWMKRLRKYGVRSLMLSPQTQAWLIAAVRSEGNWQEVYSDSSTVLFVSFDP